MTVSVLHLDKYISDLIASLTQRWNAVTALVLDLEECTPHLVASLQVFNLPTILSFSAGEETARAIGCPTGKGLTEILQNLVATPGLTQGHAAPRLVIPCMPVHDLLIWNQIDRAYLRCDKSVTKCCTFQGLPVRLRVVLYLQY